MQTDTEPIEGPIGAKVFAAAERVLAKCWQVYDELEYNPMDPVLRDRYRRLKLAQRRLTAWYTVNGWR